MPLLLVGVFSPVLATGTVPLLMAGVFVLTFTAVGLLWSKPPSDVTLRRFRAVKACSVSVLLVCTVPLWYGILTIDEREPYRRAQCHNYLRQIGVAMHDYHDEYGCFPPAYVADDDGRPMYSWRVLLLPLMEESEPELYAQFRLDEPWDSPENIKVLDAVGQYSHLHCPSDRDSSATETNYVLIVGEESLSRGPNGVTIDQISDRTSNTIMVVEIVQSGIQWTEPRDLKAEEITFRINDPERPGIGSRHHDGANVLLCDGSVTFVPETTEPELVRAMTTIAGGEDVSVR